MIAREHAYAEPYGCTGSEIEYEEQHVCQGRFLLAGQQ